MGYWQRRQIDPWLRLFHAAQARLAQQGIKSAAHETPRQLAARVGNADWQNWLLQLEALRYRPSAQADMQRQIKALRRALRQIHRGK